MIRTQIWPEVKLHEGGVSGATANSAQAGAGKQSLRIEEALCYWLIAANLVILHRGALREKL